MKKIVSLLIILVFPLLSFLQASEPYHFTVREKIYLLSKEFSLESAFRPFGKVVKSKFHLTSVYDLYDLQGAYQARGAARIFCLGLFYDWGTQIDLYNAEGEKIGLIDGQLITTAKARFSFYDSEGALQAIAYIDLSGSSVEITHPLLPNYPVAVMHRIFETDVQDHWEVSHYDPIRLDSRNLKIFSAFVVDRQNSWHTDL